MMTAYPRDRRRDVASSIAAYLDCLAGHPDAGDIVRQIALHGRHLGQRRAFARLDERGEADAPGEAQLMRGSSASW